MHMIGVLAVLIALVFGLVAFVPLIDLQADIAALTSGGIIPLSTFVPTAVMFVIVTLGVVAVVMVVRAL